MAARRSPGCWRHKVASDPSRARYASCVEGTKRGSPRESATPSATMVTAAATNIARQPNCSATKPLTTRDSRMPSSRPVMTVPTILPRAPAGARWAAAGTMSCASVADRPTTKLAASSTPMDGDTAADSRARLSTVALIRMMRFLSWRSPSGASIRMPKA
ncbi:hypothetical protein G6F50_015899 [Rhizopus delemar]|uniref:Uncharacterized protein n=1 Tax=Rhizopus delemar TaxID=936053 RepID=A0A9P7C2Y5_9FUNG|nr:hypothetical protein G6F50_015899 [Rhizopus delemar]